MDNQERLAVAIRKMDDGLKLFLEGLQLLDESVTVDFADALIALSNKVSIFTKQALQGLDDTEGVDQHG